MSAVGPRRPDRARPRPPWLADAERLDLAVYAAIAATPSPAPDSAMGRADTGRRPLEALARRGRNAGGVRRPRWPASRDERAGRGRSDRDNRQRWPQARRPAPASRPGCRGGADHTAGHKAGHRLVSLRAQRRCVRICDRGRRGAARHRDPAPCPRKGRCLDVELALAEAPGEEPLQRPGTARWRSTPTASRSRRRRSPRRDPLDVHHCADTGPLGEIRRLTCGFAVRLDRLRRQVAGTQGTPPRVERHPAQKRCSRTPIR